MFPVADRVDELAIGDDDSEIFPSVESLHSC